MVQSMRVRGYRARDVFKLTGRREDNVTGFSPEYIDVMARAGWSYTLYIGDKVVGVGGAHLFWRGVISVWANFSDAVRGRGRELSRVTQITLRSQLVRWNAYTALAFVNDDIPENARWLRVLGFRGFDSCTIPGAAQNGSGVRIMYYQRGGAYDSRA